MKAFLVNLVLIGVGVASAYLGQPLVTVLMIAVVTFRIVWPFLIKSSQKLPEKIVDQTAKRLEKEAIAAESKGKPYITTHHGPNGIANIEIGTDDVQDQQIGAGKFNFTESVVEMMRMRTAEAQAKSDEAKAAIFASDKPPYLIEMALKQEQLQNPTSRSTEQIPTRRRRKGDDVVGKNFEGNYSIRE